MRVAQLFGSALLVFPSVATADVIMDWNAALRQAAQADVTNSNPGWCSRAMAMMNGAAYDAMQAIHRTHQPLLKANE